MSHCTTAADVTISVPCTVQYNGASVATCPCTTTTRADVEICPSVLLKVLHSLHVLELVLLLPAVLPAVQVLVTMLYPVCTTNVY